VEVDVVRRFVRWPVSGSGCGREVCEGWPVSASGCGQEVCRSGR